MDYRALARKTNPFEGLTDEEAVKLKVYFNFVATPKLNDGDLFRKYGYCCPFNLQPHLGEALRMAIQIEAELARGY